MKIDEKIQKLLNKGEVIDLPFIASLMFFAVSIVYQVVLSFSQSAELRELGLRALGLGILALFGLILAIFYAYTGIIKISNYRKQGSFTSSFKIISVLDERFQKDYYHGFVIGLIIQIGLGFLFGFFLGAQFFSESEWSLNSFLLILNSGIGEEIFFSLCLTAFLLSLSSRGWHIILAGSVNLIIFGVFHMVVYKTNKVALLFILILRLLYFTFYVYTRRPSIPILLHCVNNLLFLNSIQLM
jgi:membrane protease YdiL (CAAX protease family)